CLQRQPGHPGSLYLQAQIAHRQGNHAKAVAILDPLLRAQPDSPGPLILRAILYDEAGEPDKAIPLLRQVLAPDRDRQQVARYHLSLALARTGQTEEAQRVLADLQYQEAIDLWAQSGQSANPGLQLRAAEALLALGRAEEALPLLEKTLADDPNCSAAH